MTVSYSNAMGKLHWWKIMQGVSNNILNPGVIFGGENVHSCIMCQQVTSFSHTQLNVAFGTFSNTTCPVVYDSLVHIVTHSGERIHNPRLQSKHKRQKAISTTFLYNYSCEAERMMQATSVGELAQTWFQQSLLQNVVLWQSNGISTQIIAPPKIPDAQFL